MPSEESSTTELEQLDAAIAMRRELFLRALELTHHFHDAQDLLGDVYVKFIEKPPQPRSSSQLKHWMRTVMRNKHIDAQRRRDRELLPDLSLDVPTDC